MINLVLANEFPAGQKRFVCVNRKAILHNLEHKTNFPTMIVVSGGLWWEFHEVEQQGRVSFDTSRDDLPAKVFIETIHKISGYRNVDTKDQSFLHLPIQPPRMKLGERILRFLGYAAPIPVVSCFMSHVVPEKYWWGTSHYQPVATVQPAKANPYNPQVAPDKQFNC